MYRLIWHEDLLDLAREVYERTYRPTTSTCFIVTRPKLREVFAANFRDRIVQHWLCLRLEPLFEARFVEHGNVSFNCRKGFGTFACIDQLTKIQLKSLMIIRTRLGMLNLILKDFLCQLIANDY